MGANLTINEALSRLNPEDESEWTFDGLPRMEAIEQLVGSHSITRKDVTDANPEFCRETAKVRSTEAEAPKEEFDNDQTTQVQAQINPEEVLKAHIQALSQEIETVAAEETEVSKRKDVLIEHLRRLQQETNQQHTATADTVARMAFVNSQSEQRAKRHEKGRKILAIIGKDGLNPQSRLDQAMRRKTARGTRRPPPRTPTQ